MKLVLFVVFIVAVKFTEATHLNTIVHLGSQVGDAIKNTASAILNTKQNLILAGTNALLTAKQRLIQHQLPHLIYFKRNQINALFQLKKDLLSSSVVHFGPKPIAIVTEEKPNEVPQIITIQEVQEEIPILGPPGEEGGDTLSPPEELETHDETPITIPQPPLYTISEPIPAPLPQPLEPELSHPEAPYEPPKQPHSAYGPPLPESVNNQEFYSNFHSSH